MQPNAPAPNAPKELGKPLLPPTQVTRARFSPDGKQLVAAGFDGKLYRWDVSGKEPVELPALGDSNGWHNGWLTDVAFGAGQMFTADSWGGLITWRREGKDWKSSCITPGAHDGWLRCLAVSPDGSRLVTGGKDGFVRFWATDDGRRTAEFEAQADVLSVSFDAEGKSVFVGDPFGVVREVAVRGRKVTRTFEAKELHKLDRIQDVGGVKCLMLSGDGKTLFVGGAEPKTGGFVQAIPLLVAFDIATGKRLSQWKGATDAEGYVTDLAWHPDGFVIFTTSGQPGQGKFHLWKPGAATPLFSGGKHPNCHSVALHPDGGRIAVSATNANSSGNGRVKGTGGAYATNSSPIQVWSLSKL